MPDEKGSRRRDKGAASSTVARIDQCRCRPCRRRRRPCRRRRCRRRAISHFLYTARKKRSPFQPILHNPLGGQSDVYSPSVDFILYNTKFRVPPKYSRPGIQRSQCPNTSAWLSSGSSQSPSSALCSSLPFRALVITSLAMHRPMAIAFSRGKAERKTSPLNPSSPHYSQTPLPLKPRKSTTPLCGMRA